MHNYLIKQLSKELNFFHSTAKKILPGHLKHYAADVAQDSLLRCMQKIHLFDPEKGNLKGWAYRITRNECINLINAQKRFPKQEIQDYRLTTEEKEDQFEIHQIKRAFKALSYLSENDQEILKKRIIEGLSGREISEEMGIPENQVPIYFQRAKQRLIKVYSSISN